MKCQKELFSLKGNIHYLNCAYKSPLLKSAEEACMKALARERNPAEISVDDFFQDVKIVKEYFAELINAQSHNVIIIPSVSYGFSTVLNNIKGKQNGNVITIKDEFPSGYFSLKRWSSENNNKLIVIEPDKNETAIGENWNNKLMKQINDETSVVLISAVHWMNGLKFDLEKIGQKCSEVGAKFIVDGTQSVGALSMDVIKYKIHALVCASYKWMFGTYSIALAYLNDDFEFGRPLEEAWVNRVNSMNFESLTEYEENYIPHAGRYNVGETSNFISMPILRESLSQILKWKPVHIDEYCKNLRLPLFKYLTELGVVLENEKYLANHLFALQLPKTIDLDLLKQNLKANNVFISIRGNYLRISINVFNDEKDIQKLIDVIKMTVDKKN